MNLLWALIFFGLSFLLTGIFRWYGWHHHILDIPNNRSLHTAPIPRGGGLVLVMLFTLLVIWQTAIHRLSYPECYALMGGGVIAYVGWRDDLVSLSPAWRVTIHFIMAGWAVYWAGGLTGMPDWIGALFAMIGIVWCINLYNFMDGIDGLAGIEGVFVSMAMTVLCASVGATTESQLCLWLGSVIAGFLIWNWPPAKIFMGDVGSGYLGYIFSVLALTIHNRYHLSLICLWVIGAVFICDATFTVIHRLLQGKAWYQAHREHAYQRLVQFGFSHRTVTLGILLTNGLILFPSAYCALLYPTFSLSIFCIILVLFGILWLRIQRRIVI